MSSNVEIEEEIEPRQSRGPLWASGYAWLVFGLIALIILLYLGY